MKNFAMILFCVVLLVLLITFILLKILSSKNQKKLISSIKKGDYIITVAGLSGKVLAMKKNKDNIIFVLLQTGDNTHRSYVSVDIESICQIVSNPQNILDDEIDAKEQEKQDI